MMEKFIIFAVFGFISSGTISQETDNHFVSLVHCNLIQGDLAREMDGYGKDPSKYYSTAESNLENYIKFNETKAIAVKTECELAYKKCYTDVAVMAVEFGFPAEYQTSCDFESYSRSIFFCKNIKEWPKQLWNALSTERKDCTTRCAIEGNASYTLGNGQKVATLGDPGIVEASDMLPEKLEIRAGQTFVHRLRSKNPSRTIVAWIAGFKDESNQIVDGPWGDVDTCKDNEWVRRGSTVNNLVDPDTYPLKHVAFQCQRTTGSPANIGHELVSATAGYVWTWYNDTRIDFGGGHAPVLLEGRYFSIYDRTFCQTESGARSFLVGVAFRMIDFRGLGKIIRSLSFLCGSNPTWRHYGVPVDPASVILCPTETAICALQTKQTTLDGVEVYTNIRFGCCQGDPSHAEMFVNTERPPLPTTTAPPTTTDPYATRVPSLHCNPTDELRELVGQSVKTGHVEIHVKVLLTGIGLRWRTRTDHAVIPNPEFKSLTHGVPEKFYFENKLTPSPVTMFNWNTRPNDTIEGKTGDYLWREYDPDLSNTVEFLVPPNSCAKFFRVVGMCGDWEAFPKNIYMRISGKGVEKNGTSP